MSVCLVCLGDEPPDCPDGPYHRACLRGLFGIDELPRVDIDPMTIPERLGAGEPRWSISGVQRKAGMYLDEARRELVIADRDHPSTLILKPQIERFPNVPENEHLSMVIGRLAGLDAPPCGLFRLADGTAGYLIKRFDRSDERPPQGLRKEDLCQLAGKRPEDKYEGSAELCAEVVTRYVRDPASSLRRLFRLFVVSYWIGNGDLHLKNVSLLEPEFGRGYTLSPVYDLVSSQIYRASHDPQALKVSGRQRGDLGRRHYVDFAVGQCQMSEEEAAAIVGDVLAAHDRALVLLARSPLPDRLKKKYGETLATRAKVLARTP